MFVTLKVLIRFNNYLPLKELSSQVSMPESFLDGKLSSLSLLVASFRSLSFSMLYCLVWSFIWYKDDPLFTDLTPTRSLWATQFSKWLLVALSKMVLCGTLFSDNSSCRFKDWFVWSNSSSELCEELLLEYGELWHLPIRRVLLFIDNDPVSPLKNWKNMVSSWSI